MAVACGDDAKAPTARPTATIEVRSTTTAVPTDASRAASAAATISATAIPSPTPVVTAAPSKETNADLINAARIGDLAAVQRLLAAGASVGATNSSGATALVVAAYGNHLEVAEVLVAAGADVNLQDATRQNAYLIATSEIGESDRALALLRLTLRAGADVNSHDVYNGTGLIRAADRGYASIVAELLRTTVDKDHINNLGWTALLEAVLLGGGDARHTSVVRLLVDAGVNVNIPDRAGVTPLGHARARGYSAIAAIIEAGGGR